MTEPALFKKRSEMGAAGGWREVMLCHSKKVSGRESAARFCSQMGHWSQWKTNTCSLSPRLIANVRIQCTFKLLLIEETFPLNSLCYFAVKWNLFISKLFRPSLFHNILSTKWHRPLFLQDILASPNWDFSYCRPDAEMMVLKNTRNSKHGVGKVPRNCVLLP